MVKLKLEDVKKYVEENIEEFHQRKYLSLKRLKLSKILTKKNPYLFKAKNILTAYDLVKNLLDAHLSSQEEGIFGEFLEGLSIFVCEKVFNGQKSAAQGIDLEFNRESIKYIVTIKSGPNWGNADQIRKMKENFRKAKRILSANKSITNIVAINGCCYGRNAKPDRGDYMKICGQEFWEFISNNSKLYLEIIEPLGNTAKERNDKFVISYGELLTVFNQQFTNEFCIKGRIDWNKLVRFNSGIEKIKVNL
jgi:hypothetical protein